METAQNTANKGLSMDLDEYISLNDTLTFAQNLRLLSQSDNSYVMQNLEGNEESFVLTRGFQPIGVVTDNRVSYIISHNPTTRQGEIGTYPSPNFGTRIYEEDFDVSPFYEFDLFPDNHRYYYAAYLVGVGYPVSMVNEYHPLMTMKYGSNNRYPLRSKLFNFNLNNPIVNEIVAKLSYDYSYGLYFTDNLNPIRSVNGSVVYKDGAYSINARTYTEQDFSTELNLILNTLKYTSIALQDVAAGGRLKFGNYIYYLKYKTQDSNTTSVIAQSSLVSVFRTTTGGSNGNVSYGGSSVIGQNSSLGQSFTDITTPNQVILFVSDIDPSYTSFRLIVEYSTGDDIATQEFYEIDQDFPITSTTQYISHTGFENTLAVSTTSISSAYYSSFLAKSITQLDGRLFATNIKITSQNHALYTKFANAFVLEAVEVSAGTPTIMAGDVLNYSQTGYHKPLTIYNSLGYWWEETYAFGIVFKLKDGSETQAYFPTGYDYLSTTPLTSVNKKGIIRTPKKPETLELTTVRIDVRLEFTMFGNLTIAEKNELKENIIGCKIVRADRNRDAIAQGVVCTTSSVPAGDYSVTELSWLGVVSWGSSLDKNNSNQWTTYQNATDRRVIPAPRGHTETEWRRHSGNSAKSSQVGSYMNILKDERRYAFYSPDCDLNRTTRSRLNDVTLSVVPKHRYLSGRYSKQTNSSFRTDFLYFPSSIYNENTPVKKNCKSWIVDTGRDITGGLFASNLNYLSNSVVTGNNNNSTALIHVNHVFEGYVGLVLSEDTFQGNQFGLRDFVFQDGGNENQRVIQSLTMEQDSTSSPDFTVVNIYDTEQRANYLSLYPQVNLLQYKSVTQGSLFNWETILLGALPTIQCFRGDCFVGEFFKRMWYCKTGEGYTGVVLQIITENNSNPYLRNSELVDINEGQRVALPEVEIDNNNLVAATTNFANADWRLDSPVNGQLLLFTRYNKSPESRGYNKGYSHVLGEQRTTAFDTTLPSVSNHFPTRVIYSEQQVGLSFTDFYRQIGLLNTQDYPIELGEASDICSLGFSLYLTQEFGVSKLPYKERVPISTEGQVFVSGTGVLTPYSQLLSKIGSQHTHSVLSTDNAIYGIDVNRRKLWAIVGDTVKAISDDVVSSFLRSNEGTDRIGGYNFLRDLEGRYHVRTVWDKRQNEVMFVFYRSTVPLSNYMDTFTLCYSEKLQVFMSYYTYSPSIMWNVSDVLFSFPSSEVKQYDKLEGYKHNGGGYNNFYGGSLPTIMEIVVNDNVAYSKVFDNHSVIGNNIYPTEIEWNTENQTAKRDISWLLKRKRVRQEENRVSIVIGSSDTDKGEDYNHSRVNSRIRDKYVKVRFTYNAIKKLRVQSFLTKYRMSNV